MVNNPYDKTWYELYEEFEMKQDIGEGDSSIIGYGKECSKSVDGQISLVGKPGHRNQPKNHTSPLWSN